MVKNESTVFNKWLKENNIADYDFYGKPFPPASDREFWNEKADPEIIKNGEKFLNYEWPIIRATQYMEFVKSGARLAQETPSLARRRALAALLFAEVLEHKGRFLRDIVDGIFVICEETFWGVSAHASLNEKKLIPGAVENYIDLFAAETAELLSVTHYLLKSELEEFCPDILRRIEAEIEKRIIDSYLNSTDMWWMGYTAEWVNNWSVWILTNVLTSFLFMPLSEEKAKRGITKILTEMSFYYDCCLTDGGCDEGPTYWAVSGGKLFEFCSLLFDATKGKINFLRDERVKNVAAFFKRVYIGKGYVAAFCDSVSKVSGTWSLNYRIGKILEDESFLALAKELKKYEPEEQTVRSGSICRQLLAIILKDEVNGAGEYTPENKCVLPTLQTAFIRQDKWYYSARGYNNHHSHSHNDVGNILVYYDNEPVLIDVGCGVYKKDSFNENRYNIWTMRSDWHNLPDINGFLQENSYTAECDGFSVSENKTTLSVKAAYPEKANSEGFIRTIDINDGISLCDDFAFKGDKNEVCEHFITALPVKTEDNRVYLGEEFVLTCDAPCKISVDFMDFEEDEKLISSWGCEGVNRISFKAEAGQKLTVNFKLRRK